MYVSLYANIHLPNTNPGNQIPKLLKRFLGCLKRSGQGPSITRSFKDPQPQHQLNIAKTHASLWAVTKVAVPVTENLFVDKCCGNPVLHLRGSSSHLPRQDSRPFKNADIVLKITLKNSLCNAWGRYGGRCMGFPGGMHDRIVASMLSQSSSS